MKSKNISLTWLEYDSIDELNQVDRELVIAARKASENAYAPYSKFHVGAAVRLENGLIVSGANIENAAFPSGICAERSALSNSASNYPDQKPIAIAIAAATIDGLTIEPVPPCGNCRQVIAEEEFRTGVNIRVILSGKSKVQVIERGSDLLPLQFSRNNMKLNLF
jgi:cytidine deaminase